jgi:hypothetical protein
MNKKNLRIPALFLFGIYTLYACVLAPIYQYIISDIVLSDTLWLDLVDLLYQYTEILGGAVMIGFLCYAVYRYELSGSKPMLLLALSALAFKYVFTVISISVVLGSVDLTGELSIYLVAFLLEFSIMALTVYISHRKVTPIMRGYAEKHKAATVLGIDKKQENPCLPFKRPVSLNNPLQLSVFIGTLITIGWRFLLSIIEELAFGIPIEASDIPVTVLYWLLLILLPGCIGYFLSLGCIKLSAKKQI